MTFGELSNLLPVWKERLGLSNWRIIMILDSELDDKTAYMEVEHSMMYERAVIHVNPWFVDIGEIPKEVLMRDHITDDFVESSLVHELLHLITRDLRVIARDDISDIVSMDTYRQLNNAMSRADEHAVDRLAEALVRAFGEHKAVSVIEYTEPGR